MGYLFIHIGLEEVNWLKRTLGVCISFVKHLCGPDVSLYVSFFVVINLFCKFGTFALNHMNFPQAKDKS